MYPPQPFHRTPLVRRPLARTLIATALFSIGAAASASAQSVLDAGGNLPEDFSLVEIHQSFGNCTAQGYYGPFPGRPCSNERRYITPNSGPYPVYEVTVDAKRGDLFWVTGNVMTTADGNSEALVEEYAVQCAQILAGHGRITPAQAAPPIDPVSGNISARYTYDMTQLCATLDPGDRPGWAAVGFPSAVSPAGTHLVPGASTSVVQLVVNGALVGNRARQEHGMDWQRRRACDTPGVNCRGHMTTVVSGLYEAPFDGPHTFQIQVAELTGAPLVRASIDAGGGQLLVEQYRRVSAAPAARYGLASTDTTTQNLISDFLPGSCPGNDDESVRLQPERHTVFQRTVPVVKGDILRVLARATATSKNYLETDATALGIYASDGYRDLVWITQAWAAYGTSVYYPYAMVATETMDRPETGTVTYRATLHGSNTPIDFDCNPTNATNVQYGGNVHPGAGDLAVLKFSPRTPEAPTKVLRGAREVRQAQGLATHIPNSVSWQNVYSTRETVGTNGTLRVRSNLLLQGEIFDPFGHTYCQSRVSMQDGAIAGGLTMNVSYFPWDQLSLQADLIEDVAPGTYDIDVQLRCFRADGLTRTIHLLEDGSNVSILRYEE